MSQPLVSTLNAPTGTVTANAAIVPAGTGGEISVYVKDESDVVIDIDGYFAPSTSDTDLSLYTAAPCRLMDTRETTGLFSGRISEDITASTCGVPMSAQVMVLNATVVPSQGLGFLTLWPGGQTQPLASTLNALDGLVTSNMAIVPTTSGIIDAYATDRTQLILDTSGYFAQTAELNLSGQWNYTSQSVLDGAQNTGTISLSQQGTSLTGAFDETGFTNGTIQGTLTGNAFQGTVSSATPPILIAECSSDPLVFNVTITITGMVSGNGRSMSGQYKQIAVAVAGKCDLVDSGNWAAAKTQ